MKRRFGLVAMLGACVACGGSHSSPDSVTSDDAGADAAREAAPIFEVINQPQQIDDLVLWLRADTGVTLAADGTVAGWSDLSGFGDRNAAPLQGTPGLLFVPDAYNGQPALRADGTMRNLFINAGHGYPMGHASTVFFVMTGSTAPGTNGETFDMWTSNGTQYCILETDAGVEWWSATTAAALGEADAAAPTHDTFPFTQQAPSSGLHVFAEAQTDSVEGSGYLDGCKVSSFVPVAPSLYIEDLMGGPGYGIDGTDPLGIPISWGSFNSNGDLVEVLQYDVELTEAQIAGVNTYLARRYALPEATNCSPQYQ
jgi:hypothetical protein